MLDAQQPVRRDRIEQVDHDVLVADGDQRQAEEDQRRQHHLGQFEAAGDRHVEEVSPDHIDAARVGNNRIEVSRQLCAYPQVAVYNGKGTTNDAGNFSCKNP